MSKKPNFSTEIFNVLRRRILSWEYPPHYRLTEEALCHEFGVSRAPIREVLRMLEDHELVVKTPHQGSYVQQPTLQQIDDLYDVRLALELFVVEKLVRHGMAETVWLPLWDQWQNLYHSQVVESVSLSELDESFHATLAKATGNNSLASYWSEVNARLSFVRETDITTLERLQETCQQHLPILAGIRTKNMAEAQDAMRLNIEFGRKNAASAIKNVLVRAYTVE